MRHKKSTKNAAIKNSFNNSFNGFIITFFTALSIQNLTFLRFKEAKKINIKFYRKKKGITQERLSKKVKVSRTAVTHWERGDFRPSKKHIKALARILGCTVEELLEEKKEA